MKLPSFPSRPLTSGLALLAVLSGCGPEAEPPAPDAPREPRSGGRLVVALPREPENLNPLLMRSFEAAEVFGVLHHGMVRMNEDMEFTPGLAERWAWSEDGSVLDLHLRTGVLWSDGTPFTSYDVVASYELYEHEDIPFVQKSLFNVLQEISAPDEHHVRLEFVAKIPDRIDRATLNPLPRSVTGDASPADVASWEYNRSPVTLGPYRMATWIAGQRIVVERNPNFYGRPAHIDAIEFRFVPDVNNRLLQLETGEVSLLTSIPHQHIDRLRGDPEIELHATVGRRMVYLQYNHRRDQFTDARVRRAISLAVDRTAMVEGLLYGYGQPAASPFPPVLWAFDTSLAPDVVDRERAADLLEAAGWVDGDGDGVRDRDGADLTLQLLTRAGDPVRESAAVLIREDLAGIGVEVHVEVVDWGVAMRAAQEGDFDVILMQFVAPLIVDPLPFFAADAPGNFGGYANAELEAVMEEGRHADGRASAIPVWHRFQRLFHEEQPWTMLYYPATVVGTRRHVRDATPNFISSLYGVEDWWLADAAG